ncbi:MAG: hypothetical protein NZM06_06450 [Chloroherpetonaceae bacterium]|nr:hypothetical protein [Chloroherpetonaceae bacterium]MDW8438283.1 hypothetical protein [Chloroherpetonaceae bacterium]
MINASGASIPEEMIENRINHHIQLPRFDYNELSDSALTAYRERVSATRPTSPEQFVAILNETIVPQVSAALKAVAEERALGNLKEEDLARAAANKLKGSGLTAEDVLKVLNAAYLYAPVVTRYEEESGEESFAAKISGYILWFRVKTHPDGSAEAQFLKNASEEQSGEAMADPDESYKTRRRSLSGKEYARLSAANAWARNLSVAMRRLPDFQIKAEILSVRGATPEANIGTREGIGLDDGFFAEEVFENAKGELQTRHIGFFRVASVGDTRKDPRAVSTFYPHITGGVERGVLLKEHPRFGLDVALRPKFFQFRLSRETTPLRRDMLGNYGISDELSLPPRFALKTDVTEAYGIELALHYNLAKRTGIRQFFATADIGVAFGNASFEPSAPGGIVPLTYSVYLGAMKKSWLRRWNVYLGGSVGADGLYLLVGGENDGDLYSLSFATLSLRADFGIELMLTPDILLTLGGNYKFGFPPILSELEYRQRNNPFSSEGFKTFSIAFNAPGFRDTSFNGLTISVGVSYALPSFSLSLGELEEIDY